MEGERKRGREIKRKKKGEIRKSKIVRKREKE